MHAQTEKETGLSGLSLAMSHALAATSRRRAESLEWEEGAGGTVADENTGMIDGVHCGIMNELYLPNTLSSADCQPVSILIWEKI